MEQINLITNEKMFEALHEVKILYGDYFEIGDELSALQPDENVENYCRDMNHPLGISIRS